MSKPTVIVGVIILVLVFAAGIDWVHNMTFPNGTTGANLDVPDTGIAVPPAGTGGGGVPGTRIMNLVVIDQATGKPIAGISVRNVGMTSRYRGRTGSNGIARIPIPSGKNHASFYIHLSGRGYVAEQLSWNSWDPPQEVPSSYRVELEKSAKLRGKVVDDGGHPVAGATVILAFKKSYSDPHEELDIKGYDPNNPLKTAADGTWVFSGAPRRCEAIRMTALDSRYVTGDTWSPQPVSPISKLYDGTATFILHRGVAVEGVVVNPNGSPVEGASVGIGPNRLRGDAIPPQTTDASGHFGYAFEPGHDVVLTVQASHYAPEMLRFRMGREKQNVTIKLSLAHWIAGKVVNAAGASVPNAILFLESWRGCRSLREVLQTDERGRFRWNESPADAVTFYVSAEGLRQAEQELTPDHDQTITLKPPIDIHITVTDARTDKPIQSVEIWGTSPGSPPNRGWKVLLSSSSDGRYELSYDRTQPYVLRVFAPGHLPAESRVCKPEEGDVTLEMKLTPAPAARPATGP